MEINSIYFWGIMSLATLVGAVIAYPVNVWLVAVGLKHGMGSVRALGAGGHSMEAEVARIRMVSGETPAPVKPSTQSRTKKTAHKVHRARSHQTMSMTGGTTKAQLAAMALLTLLALGAGLVLAGLSGGLAMERAHASDMTH
jgi:hypothetical protein